MIKNEIIEVGGLRWKIREAITMEAAKDAIASARVTGSVGCKMTVDETYCGGGKYTRADVVQVNSDDTERKPYTERY